MISYSWLGLIIAISAPFVQVSRADVIFGDFGPGDSYNPGPGDVYCASAVGCALGGSREIAAAFTPSTDSVATGIEVALQSLNPPLSLFGPPDTAQVSLNADINGGLYDVPGRSIAGPLLLTGLTAFTGSNCCPSQTVTFSPNLELKAGQQYWVVISPFTEGSYGYWMQNSTGATGNTESMVEGVSWFAPTSGPLPAFAVLGTPVPEPASFLLLGSVVPALWLAVRRRKGKKGAAMAGRTHKSRYARAVF